MSSYIEVLKNKARILENNIPYEIKHTTCLDLVAKQEGFENWNTLIANHAKKIFFTNEISPLLSRLLTLDRVILAYALSSILKNTFNEKHIDNLLTLHTNKNHEIIGFTIKKTNQKVRVHADVKSFIHKHAQKSALGIELGEILKDSYSIEGNVSENRKLDDGTIVVRELVSHTRELPNRLSNKILNLKWQYATEETFLTSFKFDYKKLFSFGFSYTSSKINLKSNNF